MKDPMKFEVLDHGYVELIEAWGTGKAGVDTLTDDYHFARANHDYECGIIEAARQSTQGAFRGWDEDARLLKYLHEHRHATPFEFAGMVLEVRAPIFVFREWHRHRTQSYNEMSARYAPLPDLYYRPDPLRVAERAANAGKNRQAGTTGVVADADVCKAWVESLDSFYEIAEEQYKDALAEGIPKELARIVMPVGHYTQMRAAANLRNWLAFLTLRIDPAAQYEIRQYAIAVGACIMESFPQTWRILKGNS